MARAKRRWARLHQDVSDMGVCLSTFIVGLRGHSVLLGRPLEHDAWPEKGGYSKLGSMALEKEAAWLLPATHLMMEESPDRAAQRIAREWAGLKGRPEFVMVQSHLRPRPPKAPKGNHWDICFVYEMKLRKLPSKKPWWSVMAFVPLATVDNMKIGRGHLDILEEAGYLKRKRKGREVPTTVRGLSGLTVWTPFAHH